MSALCAIDFILFFSATFSIHLCRPSLALLCLLWQVCLSIISLIIFHFVVTTVAKNLLAFKQECELSYERGRDKRQLVAYIWQSCESISQTQNWEMKKRPLSSKRLLASKNAYISIILVICRQAVKF